MTPFYFGMRQRRLFGIYEPARTSSAHAAVCATHGATNTFMLTDRCASLRYC